MAQTAPLKTQRLQVTGMDCTSCKMKIEGRLERLKGVAEASVTVATERLIISYDPQQVSEMEIQNQIKALGYKVEAERSPTIQTATESHSHDHDSHTANDHNHEHHHGSGEFNLKAELPTVLWRLPCW